MEAAISQMLVNSQLTGINAEREYEFPGVPLQFFEKLTPPDADAELLRLSANWCLRRLFENGLPQNEWECEVLDALLTQTIVNKTAYVVAGSLKLAIIKTDSTKANLGCWKFVLEVI